MSRHGYELRTEYKWLMASSGPMLSRHYEVRRRLSWRQRLDVAADMATLLALAAVPLLAALALAVDK